MMHIKVICCVVVAVLLGCVAAQDIIQDVMNPDTVGVVARHREFLASLERQQPDIRGKDIPLFRLPDAFRQPEELLQTLAMMSGNTSDTCLDDLATMLKDLLAGQMYALTAVDAFGKPPSGVLDGNFVWLGGYDECRAIVNKSIPFQGKYCTATTKVQMLMDQSVTIALCLPDTCEETDIIKIINETLPDTHVGINCPTGPEFTGGDIAAIVLTSILVLLAIVGSSLDIFMTHFFKTSAPTDYKSFKDEIAENGTASAVQNGINHDPVAEETAKGTVKDTGDVISLIAISRRTTVKNVLSRILLCFSWVTNGRKLLNPSISTATLGAVNGIRVISMWWVILGHTFVFGMGFVGNISIAYKIIQRFTFQAILEATPSVDTFFFLSGLLVAYLTLRELQKDGHWGIKEWAIFYFHRFWRLTPAYMFLVMISTTLSRHLIDGPMMDTYFTSPSITTCETKWWGNLLYINNFISTLNESCMGWSWYLANDMQFFILSPVFIYVMYRWWKPGVGVAVSVLVASLALTGGIAYHYRVGSPGSDRDVSGHIYIRPYYRIGPYMVGILTGYLLYATKSKVKLHKIVVIVGWCLAFACNMSVVYGLYHYNHESPPGAMSRSLGAFYTSCSRTAWSFGVAWVTFACVSGYGGAVNVFLSWKVWAPLGRLTYMAYLVHPIVMSIYYFNLKQRIYYTDLTIVYLFLGHLVLAYAAAFCVSLLAEAPMMALEKLILGDMRRKQEKSQA